MFPVWYQCKPCGHSFDSVSELQHHLCPRNGHCDDMRSPSVASHQLDHANRRSKMTHKAAGPRISLPPSPIFSETDKIRWNMVSADVHVAAKVTDKKEETERPKASSTKTTTTSK